jgi:PKHD-type hydroxylase
MIGIVILGINLIIIQIIKTHTVKLESYRLLVQLSDPKDYKGGELEFQFRNTDDPTPTRPCLEILPRGSIVVFPSFVWHRVKPVTEGTRYSLVIWNLGYPFR